MTGRKHVNLFVPDSPTGAICSSVIHEWAQTRYDSITVVYCDDDAIEAKLCELAKVIRIADKEGADPCAERKVIVLGFHVPMSVLDWFLFKGTSCVIHDAWVDNDEKMLKTMKRYLGFFKRKWPHGYRVLYHSIVWAMWGIAGCIAGWSELKDFKDLYGADELEKLITAYLHDLPPDKFTVTGYEMIDYYYDVFTERKQDVPNQTECV